MNQFFVINLIHIIKIIMTLYVQISGILTLLRVSDLAYPVTLLRDGRDLEFYKGHSPLMLGAWPASLALTHMLGAWQASLALTHMLGAWQASLALTHTLGTWQASLPSLDTYAGCLTSIPSLDTYARCLTSIPSLDTYAGCLTSIPGLDTYAGCLTGILALTLLSLDNKHLHVWRNKWHDCHYSLFQPPWLGESRQRPSLGIGAGEWMSALTTSSGVLHHTPQSDSACNPSPHPHCHLPIHSPKYVYTSHLERTTTHTADGWLTSGAQRVSAH